MAKPIFFPCLSRFLDAQPKAYTPSLFILVLSSPGSKHVQEREGLGAKHTPFVHLLVSLAIYLTMCIDLYMPIKYIAYVK